MQPFCNSSWLRSSTLKGDSEPVVIEQEDEIDPIFCVRLMI